MSTVPSGSAPPSASVAPAAPGRQARTTDVSERIAARLLGHPDVAELHGGPHGTTATYLPGRRVVGVHVGTHADGVEVAVVAHLHRPLPEVAAELRQAVRGVLAAADVPVHVTIADVVTPDVVIPDDAPPRRRLF